jgi:Xaa-Pro aminopeptidase
MPSSSAAPRAAAHLPLVPAAELADRANRLATRLRADGLDGAFLLHPSSHFWISGTLADGWPFVTADARAVLPIRMSVARARNESSLPVAPIRRPAELPQALRDLGTPLSGAVGIELDVVPVSTFERLRRAFPEVDFRDATRAIREVRAVKSLYEIEWVARAGSIVSEAMDRALPARIRPGTRELDLAAFLEQEMRRHGHQGVVRVRRWNLEMHLGTVSAGDSACYPCYFDGPDGLEGLYPAVQQGGGERRIQPGVPILVDYVGGAGGYLADRARIFCVGEPPAEARSAHDFCREILAEIESELGVGAIPAAIHAAVYERVDRSPWADRFMGWGENQVGFLGHGVGLDLDELPILAAGFDAPLAAGNVLAIEPKIFLGPLGAVGVENTYAVLESGPRNLTAGPEEIRIVAGS